MQVEEANIFGATSRVMEDMQKPSADTEWHYVPPGDWMPVPFGNRVLRKIYLYLRRRHKINSERTKLRRSLDSSSSSRPVAGRECEIACTIALRLERRRLSTSKGLSTIHRDERSTYDRRTFHYPSRDYRILF